MKNVLKSKIRTCEMPITIVILCDSYGSRNQKELRPYACFADSRASSASWSICAIALRHGLERPHESPLIRVERCQVLGLGRLATMESIAAMWSWSTRRCSLL